MQLIFKMRIKDTEPFVLMASFFLILASSMEFCFGLFIILWIIGITVQIVSGGSLEPSSYNDEFAPFDPEEAPYNNETLFTIIILEDEHDTTARTDNGQGA